MSDGAIVWHELADGEAWVRAIADDTASSLRDAIARDGAASLLVSGGRSPVPVFDALAMADLDWSRVSVGLVDERWVPPDNEASNTRLVREHLLRDRAASARFHPLARADGDRERAVAGANAWFPDAPTVALLGMGDDGHTASLFPGMAALDAAFADDGPYRAVDAAGCPGAQAWAERITLVPAAFARIASLCLLIRGEHKRTLLRQALTDGDARRWPVLAAVHAAATPFTVYWAP